MHRREFLTASAALLSTAIAVRSEPAAENPPFIGTNTYPWTTFAKRDKSSFTLHQDESLKLIAAAGISGYEPIIESAQEFVGLSTRLAANKLRMPSIYVNSTLHDAASAKTSIDQVLAIARSAAELGVKTIVTNPAPIRWGGTQDKTDDQLAAQAKALDTLGAELRKLGLGLAYHNHDSELRRGAREFHHMLTATDPANVGFCLDAHWVFRGCGDSQVALFDAIQHYGARIVELHLRQSTHGKWNEAFTAAGDIDYTRLRDWLKQHKISPLIVLEQAVENGSPRELSAVDAHRLSFKNAQELFAGVAALH